MNSSLIKVSPHVGPVAHQKTSDMHTIQALGETCLPPSTDDSVHRSHQEIIMQCGSGPLLALLQAACGGVPLSPSMHVKIVDVFPHVWDLIKAALIYRQEVTFRLSLHSFAANDVNQEWLQHHISTWYREKSSTARSRCKEQALYQ